MGTSEKNGKTSLLYLWARCIVNLARLLFACLFALSSDDWRGSHASRRWLQAATGRTPGVGGPSVSPRYRIRGRARRGACPGERRVPHAARGASSGCRARRGGHRVRTPRDGPDESANVRRVDRAGTQGGNRWRSVARRSGSGACGARDGTDATLWTLANFYFRRNDSDNFWPVARQALSIGDVTAHDAAPLFRLCWKLSQNPATVLERAIPDVGAVQSRYLAFLVRENLAQVAEPVTQRVVALGGERDLDAVLDYCDGLMAAGDADHAIRAWNAVCWRTLHSYHPLAPLTSPGLTNSDFASTPIQRGSDWRMPLSGVDVERGGLPPRLWITLDGRQPDTCELLAQVLAVVPSRRYRLRFRYQSDGIRPASGVRWRVADVAAREIPSDSSDLASEKEVTGTLRFRSPRAAS